MKKSHLVLLLGLIVVLALGIRLTYVFQVEPLAFSRVLIIDALDEDEWAREIAGGDWLGEKKGEFYRDPLYAYVLAALYSLFGHDLTLVRILQAVMDSALCVLLFFVGQAAFNHRAGLITAGMAALYGPFVFNQGLIMKTSFTMFLLCGFVLLLLKSLGTPPSPRWLLTGVLLGLAVMTRSNSLIFIPLVAGAALVPWNPEISRRKGLQAAALFLAGMATVLLPLAARNRVYGQSFTFTVPSAGLNFYHGNYAGASGAHSRIEGVRTVPEHEWEDARRIASLEAGRTLTSGDVSSFWMRKGLNYIRENPGHSISLLWKKTLLFWNNYEVPDVYNYDYFKAEVRWLALLLPFGIVGPLGAAGIFFSAAEKNRRGLLLSGFALLYMLSVVAFYVTARYRIPVVLFLLPLAAYAVDRMLECVRSKRAALLAASLAVTGLFALAAAADVMPQQKFLSQTYSLLGNIHHSEDRLDEAVAAYGTALATDRYNHEAANNLAYTYLRKGEKLDEALQWSLWSVKLYPSSPESLDTLSQIHDALGNEEAAREALGRAARLDPDNTDLQQRWKERRQ